MWFKNLHIYRLHDSAPLDDGQLATALPEHRFRPVSGVEARRIGWVPPTGSGDVLVHEVMGQHLVTAKVQQRLLPAGVVAEELAERVSQREAAEGRSLRRRERMTMKEQIFEELLPRAFTQSRRTDLWWCRKAGMIAVNANSASKAEQVLDLLRQSLGSLKVTPIAVQRPPSQVMGEWLTRPEARPDGLIIGDAVTLAAPGGEDGVLRARLFDLDGEEIQTALNLGRIPTSLAIEIDGRVAFTLGDDLSIKGLRFADAVIEEANASDDEEDAAARLEADFLLMANVLEDAVAGLIEWMGGEAQPTA